MDQYYLVIIEDRNDGNNYWNYVLKSQTTPLIWWFLADINIKYICNKADSHSRQYSGYTDAEIKQIYEWFHVRSPYNYEVLDDVTWYVYSLLTPPRGHGIFLGVRHIKEVYNTEEIE